MRLQAVGLQYLGCWQPFEQRIVEGVEGCSPSALNGLMEYQFPSACLGAQKNRGYAVASNLAWLRPTARRKSGRASGKSRKVDVDDELA